MPQISYWFAGELKRFVKDAEEASTLYATASTLFALLVRHLGRLPAPGRLFIQQVLFYNLDRIGSKGTKSTLPLLECAFTREAHKRPEFCALVGHTYAAFGAGVREFPQLVGRDAPIYLGLPSAQAIRGKWQVVLLTSARRETRSTYSGICPSSVQTHYRPGWVTGWV